MVNPNEIVNRVAQSGIITLDLEELIPHKEIKSIDIKGQLFRGLILKEKDFRAWVKSNDWSKFKDNFVAVYCSSDAVVPTWAYMLIAAALEDFTADVYFSEPKNVLGLAAERHLSLLNVEELTDKRVVIKGCGEREIDNHGYVKLTSMLTGKVKSLMFGEPCSTVPVYKNRK